MPITLFERDPSLWRIEDNNWTAQRKKEWEQIKKRVSALHDWKHLLAVNERYFLAGDVDFSSIIPVNGGMAHPDRWQLGEFVLQVWFHPGEISVDSIHLGKGYAIGIEAQRENYFNNRIRDMREVIEEGDAEYGLMNGREQIITEFLNPVTDYLQEYRFGENTTGAGCLVPERVFKICLTGTRLEIKNYTQDSSRKTSRRNTVYIEDLSRIVLWNHLDYAVEYHMDKIYRGPDERDAALENEAVDSGINNCLTDLLSFFDRPKDDQARLRPHTVEFVEGLLSKYEKRDFTPRMLEFWDRAKKSI